MTHQAPDTVMIDEKRWLWLNPPRLPEMVRVRLPGQRGWCTDLHRYWICEWTLLSSKLFLNAIHDRVFSKKPPYNPSLVAADLAPVFPHTTEHKGKRWVWADWVTVAMRLHDPDDSRIFMPKTWERARRELIHCGVQVRTKAAMLRGLDIDLSPDPHFVRLLKRAAKKRP